MKTLKELLELRENAVTALQAIMDTGDDESRGLSDEDKTKFTELEKEIASFDEDIKRHQSLASIQAVTPTQRQTPEAPALGLSNNEVKRFSIVKAINALANPTNQRAQDAAAFEFEVSEEACKRASKESQGIFIPEEILARDLTVGTAADGGDLVATELQSGSFIDMLRNKSAVLDRATIMSGLVGDVAIPRQTAGATGYWVAESGNPTESQQAVDQVTLSPKTVGAFTDFSRKLLQQSSISIEEFVRNDLLKTLALTVDLAAVNGSGASNQPTGILNVSGIGAVAIGTNGGAPTFAHIVDLASEIAVDNADVGDLGYLINAVMSGKLRQVEKASSTAQFVYDQGKMNGYNVDISNQVPSNLTKGTSSDCSAIIFGNFADLILGFWSGIDLLVDPYTNSTNGTIRVVAHQDMDVAVRHPESFAAIKDARNV